MINKELTKKVKRKQNTKFIERSCIDDETQKDEERKTTEKD